MSNNFQALDASTVVVLETSNTLWFESDPFGSYPPTNRAPVWENVRGFQALSADDVFYIDWNYQLWRRPGPFSPGSGGSAPISIAQNVQAFQALSDSQFVVLSPNGDLLLLQMPNDPNPSPIAESVESFQALSATEYFVLGTNGQLWYLLPFFNPPQSLLIADVVEAFQPLNSSGIMFLSRGNVWFQSGPFDGTSPVQGVTLPNPIRVIFEDERGTRHPAPIGPVAAFAAVPFVTSDGTIQFSASQLLVLYKTGVLSSIQRTGAPQPGLVTPIDTNVQAFQALPFAEGFFGFEGGGQVYVLDRDGNLWFEQWPSFSKNRVLVDRNVAS